MSAYAMLFSSVEFLLLFLPCSVGLYYLAPRRWRNSLLLLESLIFYAWGEPRLCLLMPTVAILHFALGWQMGRTAHRRLWLVLTLCVDIGLLVFFKYTDLLLRTARLEPLGLALPLGISFYLFQAMSYVVDVYRGEVARERDPIAFGLYLSFYPQLIAGPIVRYSDIDRQLTERTHSFDKTAQGIRRFIIGLGKKILIADAFAAFCSEFSASDEKSVLFFWLYGVAFSLQIYFDFSGYSDMAIGLGKIFGFDFLENFNYPFISGSITEFWRRWHMSLGSWFRDYVYIPLGGNRVSKLRGLFNIFVVWMLTGFWHGASWNFIFWGLFFALCLLAEKLWLLPYLKKAKVWNHIYVISLVLFSFVLFASEDMSTLLFNLKGLFGFGGVPLVSAPTLYYLRSYAVIFILALIGSTPLLKKILSGIQRRAAGERILNLLEPVALAGLLLVMTGYLVDGSFSPFLYFRF